MTRAVLLLAAVVLLAACDRASPPVTTTSSPATTTTAIVPTTTAPQEPVTAEGECYYLETSFVEQTVGQHIERTTYTTSSHELIPSCTFYRPDGDPAADVAVTAFPTALEAQNAAIRTGTPAADPVDGLADGGIVLVTPDRTVLAVTSGPILLVVTINQASSLEARAIAAEVAPLLD